MNRTNDVVLLIARLAVAALFLPSGIAKLAGLSGFAAVLASKGVPFPELLALVGALAEVAGPVALLLGTAPRLTAVVLVAFTIVATLISHGFWDAPEAARKAQEIQFFKNLAIIGGLLFYFVSGPGAFRVSAALFGFRSARLAQAS
jgi:putative oxidoreductase